MIRILKGDCRDILKSFKDECVDLVVTSPPYDKLRSYNDSLEWNFDIFKNITNELSRVLKPGGVIVWIVNDATVNKSETCSSFKQAIYFKDVCGLNLHDTMIWKKFGSPYPDKTRYYSNFEYMFILSKGTPKTINLIKDRKNKWPNKKIKGSKRSGGELVERKECVTSEYGTRFNVWDMVPEANHNKLKHPAVFPLSLAEDHIKTWSNEGDLVVDPMMGSGTTGEASIILKRNFIGSEKEPEYFNMSRKRLIEARRRNGNGRSEK